MKRREQGLSAWDVAHVNRAVYSEKIGGNPGWLADEEPPTRAQPAIR